MTTVTEMSDLMKALAETERLLQEAIDTIETLDITIRDLEAALARMDDDGR